MSLRLIHNMTRRNIEDPLDRAGPELQVIGMTRTPPGVRRVVSILNFIAEHPGQSFTLSEVARALKLSRATCHGLLSGLVEAGYLYRTPDKAYLLGSALAMIGRIADAHSSPLRAAQPEMRILADELDVVCAAIFRDHNDVVVHERAASRSHLGSLVPRGMRMPLRPPFGGIFFAWLPPADAEAWLDQLTPPPPPEFRKQWRAGMVFARTHGFQASEHKTHSSSLASSDWFFDDAQVDPPVNLINDLKGDKNYRLASVTAPVFDGKSKPAFILSLVDFNGTYRGRQIAHIGNRLRSACDRITTFIGGRQPQPHRSAVR